MFGLYIAIVAFTHPYVLKTIKAVQKILVIWFCLNLSLFNSLDKIKDPLLVLSIKLPVCKV